MESSRVVSKRRILYKQMPPWILEFVEWGGIIAHHLLSISCLCVEALHNNPHYRETHILIIIQQLLDFVSELPQMTTPMLKKRIYHGFRFSIPFPISNLLWFCIRLNIDGMKILVYVYMPLPGPRLGSSGLILTPVLYKHSHHQGLCRC